MKSKNIITHFNEQEDICAAMGSLFTAALCRELSSLTLENSVLEKLDNWPGNPKDDAIALRICGGFHALVLSGKDDALAKIYPPSTDWKNKNALASRLIHALQTNETFLCDWINSPPQTNEVGRAAALLPGLSKIAEQCALPIELVEIGSSAGLNLQLDRFFYTYGETAWGDQNSPVLIAPQMRSDPPKLVANIKIDSRTGCDIAPINIENAHDELRLKAYVWPDQEARLFRTAGAISLTKENPVTIEAQDAAKFVKKMLNNCSTDHAFVLMHSIMWQYMPYDTRREIETTMMAHANSTSAPVYWLSMEPDKAVNDGAMVRLRNLSNGSDEHLANVCYHGHWIDFNPARSTPS